MKKARLFFVTAMLAAALAAVLAFTACGSSATLTATYVCGVSEENTYDGNNNTAYQLNIYDDGSYVMVNSTVIYGYDMCMGITVVTTYGTYEAGESVDGYKAYTLSEATKVIVNSYSTPGGYDIHIDTDTSTYPVELPAQSEGEKVMANSKEDVIKAYGQKLTVYVKDNAYNFTLTDPTA